MSSFKLSLWVARCNTYLVKIFRNIGSFHVINPFVAAIYVYDSIDDPFPSSLLYRQYREYSRELA